MLNVCLAFKSNTLHCIPNIAAERYVTLGSTASVTRLVGVGMLAWLLYVWERGSLWGKTTVEDKALSVWDKEV